MTLIGSLALLIGIALVVWERNSQLRKEIRRLKLKCESLDSKLSKLVVRPERDSSGLVDRRNMTRRDVSQMTRPAARGVPERSNLRGADTYLGQHGEGSAKPLVSQFQKPRVDPLTQLLQRWNAGSKQHLEFEAVAQELAPLGFTLKRGVPPLVGVTHRNTPDVLWILPSVGMGYRAVSMLYKPSPDNATSGRITEVIAPSVTRPQDFSADDQIPDLPGLGATLGKVRLG